MSQQRRELGAAGEAAAAQFLTRLRYKILERNYRCPAGEVDLIALDRGTVVFVEVKTRHQDNFGSPFEAVDGRKQRRIERAAAHYLARRRLNTRDARFDVVGVHWENDRPHCEIVRDAFPALRW
jgi:putative endonuclease